MRTVLNLISRLIKKMAIYKITNLINHKIYIGKTCKTITMREINKCVSTMADECKPVGLEISANSEREATLNNVEDIVSADSDIRKNV